MNFKRVCISVWEREKDLSHSWWSFFFPSKDLSASFPSKSNGYKKKKHFLKMKILGSLIPSRMAPEVVAIEKDGGSNQFLTSRLEEWLQLNLENFNHVCLFFINESLSLFRIMQSSIKSLESGILITLGL